MYYTHKMEVLMVKLRKVPAYHFSLWSSTRRWRYLPAYHKELRSCLYLPNW